MVGTAVNAVLGVSTIPVAASHSALVAEEYFFVLLWRGDYGEARRYATEMAKRLALEGAAADVALKGANVRKTHAGAEQALATAEEKRAKVGTDAAAAHIDAAEFARDTLAEAHRIATAPPLAAPPMPAP